MEKIGRVEVKNVGMVDEKFCQLSIRRRALKQPSLLDWENVESGIWKSLLRNLFGSEGVEKSL